MFREATPEERRRYYREEWKLSDVPEFILSTLAQREFGFDHRGEGPSDRYNRISTPAQLEGMLVATAPYAAFASVSFYEKPERRKGWLGAELVFDVDAKDLPLRPCSCSPGEVCELCLNMAKEYVLELADVLRDDFALRELHFVYSGRGYHLRVLDREVLQMQSPERGSLLDYVAGGAIPESELLELRRGYPRVFRMRILHLLPLLNPDVLRSGGITLKRANTLLNPKTLRRVANELEEGKFATLKDILKGKGFASFLELARRINAEMLDAKVTVDVKRILRLPSSLHSKASMKCMEVKDMERFDPLKHAVPRFVQERG
ncbi:DNA primase catalytic subunit PriS [Candidatus Pyrohabitans sp.]